MKTIEAGIMLMSLIVVPLVAFADEPKPRDPLVLPFLDDGQAKEKAKSQLSKPPMRQDEPGDYCDFSPLTG